jgi:hypothetical protein
MRLLAIVLPIFVLGLAYTLDWPRAFGAHHFWSQDVVLYGGPVGIALALAGQWLTARSWALVAGFGLAAGASYAVAKWGQTRFAASFAEDAFAGQMWFFGWIAVALFAAAAMAALVMAARTSMGRAA